MSLPAGIFALVALVPVVANPALPDRGVLSATLCGSGAAVSIPLGDPLPGTDGGACCAKGCHSGERRKRAKAVRSPARI
jgi:hypothetical protein